MWPWKKRAPIVEPQQVDARAGSDVSAAASASAAKPTIPTTKFNPTHVPDEVRANIAATLQGEPRLSTSWRDIYPEAVLSVEEGRDHARLMQALQVMGWSSADAGELTRHIHNRQRRS
jgi:hypothetical protein